MFEKKSVNKGEILAEYINSNRSYGEIIRRQEIEDVTGERWKTTRYYSAVSGAKKLLLKNCGKLLLAKGKGDYTLAYPGDYAGKYVNEVKIGVRRIRRSGKILENAPTKEMSREEIQEYNRVYDFHKKFDAACQGGVTEVKLLARKPHALDLALKPKTSRF